MKKTIIVSGAASLALAAMPVVGAFAAAETSNTMTDNINVTVPASCSIVNTHTDPTAAKSNVTNNYSETINNGQHKEISSAATPATGQDSNIGVTCNTTDSSKAGWKITAVGASTNDTTTKNRLIDENNAANYIASGATQGANHPTSGATSDWAFKVNITTGENVGTASGFTNNAWTQVPTSEIDVATGTGTAAPGTLKMSYGVYVSGTQPAGTYKGAVKYTLYNPAS